MWTGLRADARSKGNMRPHRGNGLGELEGGEELLAEAAEQGFVTYAEIVAACPQAGENLEVLKAILAGGSDKVQEAGGVTVGGHTIADSPPKYGLAVTGVVCPDKLMTNALGQVGDALVLTKPLGTGTLLRGYGFKPRSHGLQPQRFTQGFLGEDRSLRQICSEKQPAVNLDSLRLCILAPSLWQVSVHPETGAHPYA